jgi:hypothetical protein
VTEFGDKLKRLLQAAVRTPSLETRLARLERSLEAQSIILSRLALSHRARNGTRQLSNWEFRVYSQWGEDGIIQGLIDSVTIARPIFVEFGVEDYHESNTRFLLVNNNWSGLILDSNIDNIQNICDSELYWRYDLKAKHAFITRDNINSLLRESGITGEIGLLSIDIDGNDYWVWQRLNEVSPDIVVVEYNHRFGPTASVSVPYRPDFERAKAHFSMIYFGASLAALCKLGESKGYAFVGCNSAGNDAFFVKRDKLPDELRPLHASEGFVSGRFRESRDEDGRLAYLEPKEEQLILRRLELVEV